jgi:transposase
MIDRSHDLPITKQAKALGINRGSVYSLPRPVPAADLAIMRRIDELHLNYPFAGSRMLRDLLALEGVKTGRLHVATLMKRMAIEAIYRKPNTSKPAPGHKIYPYLLRDLPVTKPDQVWATDISYIPMAHGFVYLVAVVDWFSRRVLSHRVSISMEADFCVEALQEALAQHGKPRIFNTDSQRINASFRRLGMAATGGTRRIVGGVDTHKDLHVAAVVDEQDRVIGTRSFATTRQGYRQMLAWMRSFGELQRIGIESTGSYGAGLLRFMQQAKVAVLEVTTPDKQDRRRRGKNDDLDAQNAAHAAFAGQRTVTPRSRDGMIESLRILMACRKTAVSARRVALQMIHNTIVCAPDGLRDQLRSLTRMQLVRTLASWRPDLTAYRDLDSAYRIGLKSLARRYLELHDEIADLDVMIAAIVDELAANLVARNSIGHIGAAQLLLTAGDNPERLRSEASFASLCGVSPVPASSGKTVRHRLNRGGDRAANSALHIIAIGRLRTDQRTKDYVARRIAEGHSKLDAIRALKRYLAREVFTLITQRRKEINATRIAA